jgi:type I restriction enzyme R subunit
MSTLPSERALERLICTALTGHPCEPAKPDWVEKPPTAYGGVGWLGGTSQD